MTPTTEMINRIGMLQTVAESFGYAVAMPPEYEPEMIDVVATELSDIILEYSRME